MSKRAYPAKVQPVAVETLIDFQHGPFSDPKKYTRSLQRKIVERCLHEVQDANSERNTALITKLKAMLKML